MIWLNSPEPIGEFLNLEVSFDKGVTNDHLIAIETGFERLFQEWIKSKAGTEDWFLTAQKQLLDSHHVQKAISYYAPALASGKVVLKFEPHFFVFNIEWGSKRSRFGIILSAMLMFGGGVTADVTKDVAKEVVKQEICRMHVPVTGTVFDRFISDYQRSCDTTETPVSHEFYQSNVELLRAVARMDEQQKVMIYGESQIFELSPASARKILEEMARDAVRRQIEVTGPL